MVNAALRALATVEVSRDTESGSPQALAVRKCFGRYFPVWPFTVDEDAKPQLKIQQAPNAITVIAAVGAMLMKHSLEEWLCEQSASKCPRREQQILQPVELWSRQPGSPRRRKT